MGRLAVALLCALIGTQLGIAEEVSAAAVQLRAALCTIHPGDDPSDVDPSELIPKDHSAVEMAAALAGFTGGDCSRGPSGTIRFHERAGRQDRCLDRVAFTPPVRSRSAIYRATVTAAGNRVPVASRVQDLPGADRSMRRVRALLAEVGPAGGLPLRVAIVPVEAGRRRWSVAVQVALDADSLETVGQQGEGLSYVEVGALLENERTGKSWEMLAVTEVRNDGSVPAGHTLLYERVLENLRPGPYRLRGFARNAALGQVGRAEVDLQLAPPRRGGMTGPVAAVPSRNIYISELPLLEERGGAGRGVLRPRQASAPLGQDSVRRGEQVQISTWICAQGEPELHGNRIAFIEQGGVPIYQLPEGWVEPSGRCSRVTDLLHTVELPPGIYAYRVMWEADPADPQHDAGSRLTFTITEKGSELARAAD